MAAKAADQIFQQIFGANFDDVHAYCLRRLPREEAADAVSEVFLVAWRRIEEIPSGGEARLWLFGVARNVVRNLSRSSRRRYRAVARIGGTAVAPPADPETQVVAADEYREVMAAFHRLDANDQEILRLRLWEELSVTEAATVLQVSEKAASKRYQRAVARLAGATNASPSPRMRPHLHPRGGEQ